MASLPTTSQPQQSDLFTSYRYMQLTTYRKNGEGLSTIVLFAHHAGKLYVMTPSTAGKLKRIRNNGRATFAPCKPNGQVMGEKVEGKARILAPDEKLVAHQAMARKHGLVYRFFLFLQKLRKVQCVYIEIQPVQD